MNLNVASPTGLPRPPVDSATEPLATPVLLWAVVALVAMLSYYIHLVNEQVTRGERLREAFRSQAVVTASATPSTPSRSPRAAAPATVGAARKR